MISWCGMTKKRCIESKRQTTSWIGKNGVDLGINNEGDES